MCGTRRAKVKLGPFAADIPINLWGRGLLQQWCTQINIVETIPERIHDEIRREIVDTRGEDTDNV